MKIHEIYKRNKINKKPTISLEIFPPKKSGKIEIIYQALDDLRSIQPDFISVTYGAGGSQVVDSTLDIAVCIKEEYGIESLHHLTGIKASYEKFQNSLKAIRERGVENILALRGDLPMGIKEASKTYPYAKTMITEICEFGGFDVGAACYPEGHIELSSTTESMDHLRQKEEAGANFFISQLFFNNDLFYRLLDDARASRICAPISAGIMPILNRSQVERMIFMCGVSLPSKLIKLIHKYEHDVTELRKASLDYALEQIDDLLAHGVDGVHIYTMNRPNVAKTALRRYRTF